MSKNEGSNICCRDNQIGDNNYFNFHHNHVPGISGIPLTVKWGMPLTFLVLIPVIILYVVFFLAGPVWINKAYGGGVVFYLLTMLSLGLGASVMMGLFALLEWIIKLPRFDLAFDGESITYSKYRYRFVDDIWRVERKGWLFPSIVCYVLPLHDKGNVHTISFNLRNIAQAQYLKDVFDSYKSERLAKESQCLQEADFLEGK